MESDCENEEYCGEIQILRISKWIQRCSNSYIKESGAQKQFVESGVLEERVCYSDWKFCRTLETI